MIHYFPVSPFATTTSISGKFLELQRRRKSGTTLSVLLTQTSVVSLLQIVSYTNFLISRKRRARRGTSAADHEFFVFWSTARSLVLRERDGNVRGRARRLRPLEPGGALTVLASGRNGAYRRNLLAPPPAVPCTPFGCSPSGAVGPLHLTRVSSAPAAARITSSWCTFPRGNPSMDALHARKRNVGWPGTCSPSAAFGQGPGKFHLPLSCANLTAYGSAGQNASCALPRDLHTQVRAPSSLRNPGMPDPAGARPSVGQSSSPGEGPRKGRGAQWGHRTHCAYRSPHVSPPPPPTSLSPSPNLVPLLSLPFRGTSPLPLLPPSAPFRCLWSYCCYRLSSRCCCCAGVLRPARFQPPQPPPIPPTSSHERTPLASSQTIAADGTGTSPPAPSLTPLAPASAAAPPLPLGAGPLSPSSLRPPSTPTLTPAQGPCAGHLVIPSARPPPSPHTQAHPQAPAGFLTPPQHWGRPEHSRARAGSLWQRGDAAPKPARGSQPHLEEKE